MLQFVIFGINYSNLIKIEWLKISTGLNLSVVVYIWIYLCFDPDMVRFDNYQSNWGWAHS